MLKKSISSIRKLIGQNKLITIIFVIFICSLFYWSFFSAPQLKWPLGKEQSYYLDMQSKLKTINLENGSVSSYLNKVSGVLSIKIMKIENDIVTAGFYFKPDKIVIFDNEHPLFVDLYEYPFYVNFLKNGKIDSIRYITDLAKQDIEYVKTMMSYLSYCQDGYFSWENLEETNGFTVIEKYKTGFRNVNKIRILDFNNKSEKIDDVQNYIIDSTFKYGFKSGWFWYASLDVVESWRTIRADSDSVTDVSIKVEPIKMSIDDVALSAINGNINTGKTVKQSDITIFEKIHINQVAEKITVDTYKDYIRDFKDGILNQTQFNNKICDFLRIYPEMAMKFYELIRNKKINNKTADSIMFSMGVVGNIECQRVLLELTIDNNVSDNNRKRSAIYLGDVKNPDLEIVSKLADFEYNFDTTAKTHYSSAVINSLGRMYYNVDQNSETAIVIRDVIKNIIYDDSGKNSVQMKTSALYAIANTSSDEFLSEIEYVKNNEKAITRGIAAKALINIDITSEYANRLINEFATDDDAFVRKNAIKTESKRGYREEFKNTIVESFPEEKDYNVRSEMIDYLGENRDKDENIKPYLRSILEIESNKHLRNKIYKILYED